MSFTITTEKTYVTYQTFDELISDYRQLIKTILKSPVIEFQISDHNNSIELFKEHVSNIPIVTKSRRLVYFGDLAHHIVYNLALSGEFPEL